MSRIRGSGNRSTELRLVEIMRASGITGWRRNQKLPGRPDFVFWFERLAVFVDGCFWHCCPKCSTRPKNNSEFWDKKLESNRKRDCTVRRELKARAWRVLRLWEHELKYERLVTKKITKALERD
jgi:DNA mismatch endonuclease (patch repair protein)